MLPDDNGNRTGVATGCDEPSGPPSAGGNQGLRPARFGRPVPVSAAVGSLLPGPGRGIGCVRRPGTSDALGRAVVAERMTLAPGVPTLEPLPLGGQCPEPLVPDPGGPNGARLSRLIMQLAVVVRRWLNLDSLGCSTTWWWVLPGHQ